MASWIQLASFLFDNMKLGQESDQASKKFLVTEEGDTLGGSVLSKLIEKAVVFPKGEDHVGLRFLVKIIPELNKDDLHRNAGGFSFEPHQICPVEASVSEFLQFLNGIIDEVYDVVGKLEISCASPILSLMNSYIIFLEKTENELLNDRPVVHEKFKSLMSLVNNILIGSSKVSISIFIHLLKILAHLEKVIIGGEESIEKVVKQRAREVIDLTVMSLENTGLGFLNLMGFGLKRNIFCFLVTHMSKVVAGGEIHFENLIKDNNESTLMEDSRKCIIEASCGDLRGSPFVKFEHEEGIGIGPLKEWLYFVTKKMLNPECKFFKLDVKDQHKIMPTLDDDDLEFFVFFGRLMAIALMHCVQVGLKFDPILVQMLAEREVTLQDVKTSDPELYTNMVNMLKSDLMSLFPDLSVMDDEDKKKLAAISTDDCKSHTNYDTNDLHILSFWEIVDDFSAKEKSDLLFYWTRVRFLPPGGFGNLDHPLVIMKNETSSYLRATTCDFTLHIPPASYEELKMLLQISIGEPSVFGFK
ncbi:E3 ubiquitin-protein ligase HW1 [Orobanche minor]